ATSPALRLYNVGGSFFYSILLNTPFNFASTPRLSKSFSVNDNVFLKAVLISVGSNSDVVSCNNEYQSGSMSFSKLFVGLSQCLVWYVSILINQSKYF